MKKIFFILTSVLSFGFNCNIALSQTSNVFESAPECDELGLETEIVLKSSYGKLKYDTTLPQKQLTKLAQKTGAVEKGNFANGLAVAIVGYEVSVDTIARLIDDDIICVVPSKVDFSLGYKDPTIYISKDLKAQSCEYYTAIRHEEAHMQINKTTLDYYLPKIKSALNQMSKDIKPIRVRTLGDVSEATSIITQEYISYTKPLVAHYNKALSLEHSKLDNYKNYEYENSLCSD